MYSNEKVAAAEVDPVTLAEARMHLRITDVEDTTDDPYILGLITGATEYVEEQIGRALISATWKAIYDCWPVSSSEKWWDGIRQGARSELYNFGAINLPFKPISSVTSITSYDDADIASTVASNVYDVNKSAGRINLRTGQVWPVGLRSYNAVEILYKVGYGDNPADVPRGIRQGILLLVGHWYENREIIQGGENFVAFTVGEIPHAVTSILKIYKVRRV